jgi:hypothetical protein
MKCGARYSLICPNLNSRSRPFFKRWILLDGGSVTLPPSCLLGLKDLAGFQSMIWRRDPATPRVNLAFPAGLPKPARSHAAKLDEQFKESARLESAIRANLRKMKNGL